MAGTSVYVAVWVDRHCGPTPHVFADRAEAIRWAREQAQVYASGDVVDEELTALMKRGGWLYYGCYSCEGDYIYITECAVQ